VISDRSIYQNRITFLRKCYKMIKIICVGKLKEKYVCDGVNDYLKRISKYHKINLIEVNDSNINNEAVEIIKYIDNRDYVICLDILGNALTSLDLADRIDKIFISYPVITFVIGGSNGIREDIKQRCNYRLSFSKLTFPHGLFRMILLEQIYRSFKILNNESYHK